MMPVLAALLCALTGAYCGVTSGLLMTARARPSLLSVGGPLAAAALTCWVVAR